MATLEGRFDYKTAEPKLQAGWAESGIYEFDPNHPGRPYTVDTPPPTVSGQIHVGHVYSYTHADIIIRYHRMLGEQVLYPFGFDDNGLPTERFTENNRGVRAREIGRQAFIDACLALSEEVETKFEKFWKRLGLSVDWRIRYSTINPNSRRVSQEAFIDLFEKGLVYRQTAPTLWCPECRTAVAQADVDDKDGVATQFSTIPFELVDGDDTTGSEIRIATTRPELLAACVAVFVHPEDDRYRPFVGRTARTPIFGHEVPILADEKADKDKGTGAVMCCTFGDVTDVAWWRGHGLPLRIVLTPEGRMTEEAGAYTGMRIKAARAKILEDLAASGKILEQRAIEHSVGVHERCGTDIEYLVAGQWFVELLKNKQKLIDAGRQIAWHPEHMRARYESWIEGLNWDWNISRQRYYGVAFPVWYCRACGEPIVADRAQLPVDPQTTSPAMVACPKCGCTDFDPETDVMDTWATSSVTPEIIGSLLAPLGISPEEFDRRFRPMSLRPNAHDIIRTWDFYTIVRSLYRRGTIPWGHVLISGHALDPHGKKISKSKLKAAEDPTAMLEQYSADAVRYWTASVRTGGDTLLSEDVFKSGSRLVTKLWNAAKLALPHLEAYQPPAEPPAGLVATDAWLLSRLAETIARATTAMSEYEFAAAKAEVERFFWTDFCDNYLELVKFRLYGDSAGAIADEAGQQSARYTLYHTLVGVLKLLAPFMPHITEAIYLAGFAATDGAKSVHVAHWPVDEPAWRSESAERAGQAILDVADAARRWKADRQVSVGAPVATVKVKAPSEVAASLASVALDLRSVTRAAEIEVSLADAGASLTVEIVGRASA